MNHFCFLLLTIPVCLSEPREDGPGMEEESEEFRRIDRPQELFWDNPKETPEIFEGDIMLRPMAIPTGNRNAVLYSDEKWANGIVPFMISNQFDRKEINLIKEAMEFYHKETCLRFIERTDEEDFIYIEKIDGCKSYVGKVGGRQSLSLVSNCFYGVVPIMHELMHALGFYHEQSRADRDKYIKMNWEYIPKGKKNNNFLKYELTEISHLNASYDVCSIMHYRPSDFAKPSTELAFEVLENPLNCDVGNAQYFSETDIRKLNSLYQCTGKPQTWNTIPVPPPPCRPTSRRCDDYVNMGYCKKDPDFMEKQCCGLCTDTCYDTLPQCTEFRDQYGLCETQPDYMRLTCEKTCNFCSTNIEQICEDERPDRCPTWVQAGLCTDNRAMAKPLQDLCKNSCGLC